MSVLNVVSTCMLFKKDNKWAQAQQPTNNVSRVRNQRMSWTTDSHEKFVEIVQILGGADNAKPDKILRLLQCNYKGFEDVKRDQVSSHLQKYRDNLKKSAQPHMLGYKVKDGTSSEHIQSRCHMEEHIQTHNFTSMIQKRCSKVQRMEDALRDETMNTTYQLDLSSSPQQLATAAGNMCLQPNVGTQVLQNIQLPLSSGTIEGTIIQDQALVANVAGKFSNTSLPSSSQYKVVDANETAMPGSGPNDFTRLESPDDDFLSSLLTDFSSSSQDCVTNLEVLLGADGSLPSSSQDQAIGNGPNNTSDDTDFDILKIG